MEKSTEILNELRSISPSLSKIERVNVFCVPDGYFIGLDEKIATCVFLHREEKNNLQKVPEGYFDSLSTKILSRINQNAESAEDEVKLISPALHRLKEENVFTVPEQYFANLDEKILNKINQKKAKVVSFNPLKVWWKYAAAAVVAGIITITSLHLLNTSNSSQHNTIASASVPAYVQLASQYKTPKQLDQGIASLTDDEIAGYLEKNTNVLDDETLIKNTDTKELPSADDYLIDDNALNNYLQKINAASTHKNTQ